MAGSSSSTASEDLGGRSREQIETESTSTSPPLLYYDSEFDDDGPKPHELYGKHTWTIEKFESSKTREVRGEKFDVGGYKWYLLIYPKGCDVPNHLSLFLCVANHEKLLPGWSYLAQFSISVVNKDPKKSKYSDTMHRFWKKEHDWGWKKFMELSKLKDGFLDDKENLVIKAEVQVIRERTNRPFRCLDYNYRRELVRVYLSNVDQSCREFFEKTRSKFTNLTKDKQQWSSFQAFWIGTDRISRRRLSRDHSTIILKQIVKHFFIEKEVTSTLVMDSLYTGFKALEYQSLCLDEIREKERLMGTEPMPDPVVIIEDEVFILNDDLVGLIECVVNDPFLYKDDKIGQNGKKDDFNRDSVEIQEWRMAELGRRTMEVFALDHIFTKVEDSFKEAVALQMQEELIREEELNGNATNDIRAKNGNKDNKRSSKKKQAKQKKNNRKENKGKGKDFTLEGKIVENSNESDSNFTKKPEISEDLDNNSSDNSKPLQTDPIETTESIETETPKGNISPTEEIQFQDFSYNINRRRLSRKGNNNNNRRSRSYNNNNRNNSNNYKEFVNNGGTSSPSGETPTHSGRYYSGNYRRNSETDNIVDNLKDHFRHLQQRLNEVEDSLLKHTNAKNLSEVFPKTEIESVSVSSSSSSSSPMKNSTKPSSSNHLSTQIPKLTLEEVPKQTPEVPKQTLEVPKQTLKEIPKQTLEEIPKQSIEIKPKTMQNAWQTQEKTLETLKSAETLKPITKNPVPVPLPVPTYPSPSKPKPENQKQKQIMAKDTNNSTNTNTGTKTATNTTDICTNFIKVGPRLKTKPKSSQNFSVSQPTPSVSVSPSKPPLIPSHSNLTLNPSNPNISNPPTKLPVILSHSNLTLNPSNPNVSINPPTKPPVILSHSNLTLSPNHGLRFGTFTVEPPQNPKITDEPLDFPDELKNTFTYLSPIKNRVPEELIGKGEISKEKQREIANSLVPEDFPFVDLINDLLDEDQYGLGFNQSFFSRPLPRHRRTINLADVSPSSNNQEEKEDNSYEMIKRSHEAYDRRQAEISRLEALSNQNAYISMAGTNVVPVGNVSSFNGYSPYRYGEYGYSADVANVGYHNDWYNSYYSMNGTNGNLGHLRS